MKTYESSAKTVEEAISQGLNHLGVAINDVTIDIVNEGSKGLFGLFGAKQAKVRLTLKKDAVAKDAAALITAAHEKAKKEFETPALSSSPSSIASPSPQKTIVDKTPREVQVASKESIATAKSFLEQLVKHMDVDAMVHVSTTDEGSILLQMEGENMGLLIGHHGETLDALQYLVNLYVNKGQENYTRITLDTENYRAKREESLIRLANRMANRAVKTGRRVSLEPMNPYERRIIHSALHENQQVDTHSEGNDPYRRLVITKRKSL